MSTSGGHVRKRPNGTWEGRYREDGRQKSVYARTEKEAQEALRKAMTRVDSGVRVKAHKHTVATYLKQWLDTSVTQRCRPSTLASYRETVDRYIVPAIGSIQLSRLKPDDVRAMLAHLARGTISTTTQRYVYTVLRIALGRALKDELVLRNVATLVDPPRKARPEMHPLTADQARQFLVSVRSQPCRKCDQCTAGSSKTCTAPGPSPLHPLYVLALSTGARQGELLGLRWSDIDLDEGTVAIRHTLSRLTGELGAPKTERGRRTLRPGAGAIAVLKAHKQQQRLARLAAGSRWKDGDWVFTTSIGTPWGSGNVLRAFQSDLKQAGLPHQRFHDLRHAYATMRIEDGDDLTVVSRSLGHGNISTTADVYAHITKAMQDRSASRQDSILGLDASATG